MKNEPLKANIKQSMCVTFQLRIRDVATGKIVRELPAKKNLVMDKGLDNYASTLFINLFSRAIVGTGTNPVNRYSAPVTFTQSGNVVTASAPFFAGSDVGYILKYGASGSGSGGAEQYITAFTDSQHVTVSSSATVAIPTAGCVWYVTQTSLQTPVKSTSSYAGGGNGHSDVINASTLTRTYTRIFIFSAETGTVTYQEIGWDSGSGNIFGRSLIVPSGVTLVSGQQLEATVQVALTIGPTAVVSVGDVSGGTWNTAGTALIEYFESDFVTCAISGLTSSGASAFNSANLEPSGLSAFLLFDATWTQRTSVLNAPGPAGNNDGFAGGTLATYSPGSFTQSMSTTLPLGNYNTTWYGIGVGVVGGPNGSWNWSLQLTTPNSKDSSHTLSFTFSVSWGRILVN